MNKNIKDKILTDKQDVSKNHQAFAMELSRLKAAKKICLETKNCSEYNTLGGDSRYMQIETMVQVPRKTDEIMRDSQKETNPNNTTQKEKSPTEVGVAKITKGADHKKSENNDVIISNAQALNEEISNIKYLIEYMNNNNKKQNL